MTNKLAVIINSLKVPKIEKILIYEMKFLVPNYSCLQNPWLGGYRPQIPVLSVLCPQLNLLTPPTNKIPGYATGIGTESPPAQTQRRCCTSQHIPRDVRLAAPFLSDAKDQIRMNSVTGEHPISCEQPFFTHASHKITRHRLQGAQEAPFSVTLAVMLVTRTSADCSVHCSLPSSAMFTTSQGDRYPRFYQHTGLIVRCRNVEISWPFGPSNMRPLDCLETSRTIHLVTRPHV